MSSHHIHYGIDLGTTNSAIALVDRGTVTILKNDFQHDTTPSAIHYTSRGIRVGQRARNQWFRERFRNSGANDQEQNAFLEFKRTMGTDHRYRPSSRPDIAVSSEELSAEVLKGLLRFARLRGGAGAEAAVVTIPAAFRIPQQQATQKAATLAGIEQCHLLQEPVAAAMAFGLEAEPGASAKWLVFDFGGGTFDAALVLAEEGQITVKDTEGDNRLGGKDLDLAVVVRLLWPEIAKQVSVEDLSEAGNEHLRQGLRQFAEGALIALSTQDPYFIESDMGIRLGDSQEIDLDLQVSHDEIRPIVAPYFQRAIDKSNLLLQRNGLRGADLDELVLVGGPTYLPILRNMVADQLRPPNSSVDPMTAVARGAALYASTVPLDGRIVARSLEQAGPNVLALVVEHETTTINEEEFVTVRLRDPGVPTGSDRSRSSSGGKGGPANGWRSSQPEPSSRCCCRPAAPTPSR
ncbi:MAG: Hsp70 family protein [Acidobacteria bacterium]|nr:Hsp70 family protein [Acidobacteriota bacterium]